MPRTLDKAYEQVLQELMSMFLKKHKDYGKGNITTIQELGIALRINEKAERIKNLLLKNSDPANESIEENWVDIAVYAIIAVLYRRGWFEALEVDKKRLEDV